MSIADKSSAVGRRNFIYITTGAVAAVGVCGLAVPMLGHLAPTGENEIRNIDVDLRLIPEGQEIKIRVNGKPVAIRHRAPWEIALARQDDGASMSSPEVDEDRLRAMSDGLKNPKYLIVSLVCTHFGSVVTSYHRADSDDRREQGWFCESHGAYFDTSGRLRGGPGGGNLPVPEYEYVNPHVIRFRTRNV